MRKTTFFGGKAVHFISKNCGLLQGFYYVVVFEIHQVVGGLGVLAQAFQRFLQNFYSANFTFFMSVIDKVFHQIHKTYNNKLQVKLINS